MKREGFALFWSIPPDQLDWDNLLRSGVKRVQIMLAFADQATVRELRANGIRCTIRLDQPDYVTVASRQSSRDKLALLTSLAVVDTVIIGVEPENAFNLKYGSLDWGQEAAREHTADLAAMRDLIRGLGLRTVSAGWTAHGIDMNWNEGVQPGLYAWLEITRPEYNSCDLNGFHWYGYDGTDYDMRERMRRHLWFEQGRRHKPLYIDECGVGRGTPAERMLGYVKLATMLVVPLPQYGRMGDRVECFTPFVSNGIPDGSWDAGFLLRDPAAYTILRQFMDGQNF